MKWNKIFKMSIANIALLIILLVTFIFPDFFYEKKFFVAWAGAIIIYYVCSMRIEGQG